MLKNTESWKKYNCKKCLKFCNKRKIQLCDECYELEYYVIKSPFTNAYENDTIYE